MRHVIALVAAGTLVAGVMAAAQEKKPQQKPVLRTKIGDVIFSHAMHISREKGECAACHEKLWPRSAKEPLKSSAGCRTCHRAEGGAFEMKGNCVKCHPKGVAKTE